MSFDGFAIPDDVEDIRQTIRRFLQREVIPAEQELEPESTELPEEVYAAIRSRAKANGLWSLCMPKALGGGGLGFMAQVVLLEEITQHRNGLYNPGMGVFGRPPPSITFDCDADQAERWVRPAISLGQKTFFAMSEPRPSALRGGADPTDVRGTTAVWDGAAWTITGRKTWISNGATAEWGIVFANAERDGCAEGMTCFFVSRGEYSTAPIPVIRADYPQELIFEGLRIPDDRRLGGCGDALSKGREMLLRNQIAFSAAHVGVATAALEIARSRCSAAVAAPLRDTLADSEIEIRAARWLLWEAAWLADQGAPFRHEGQIAKLATSEALVRTVDRAIQILGGDGVTKEIPLERWYREARGRLVAAGPSHVLRSEIAARVQGQRRD